MKKFIAPALVLLVTSGLYAACLGPFCYDEKGAYINGVLHDGNGFSLPTMTLAQMNAATPTAAGQMIYVSDGVNGRVCISSGTTRGGYVLSVASGTFVGTSYPHCN